MKIFRITAFALLLFSHLSLSASPGTDSLFNVKGGFDEWRVYELKESGIIGGNIKTIYKLSSGDTLRGQEPYVSRSEDVFSPCNIMANVLGVVKGSNSVFPEKRGDGYCARLSVIMEKVRVFGLIDMEVLVQGTILSGYFQEPIRDTKGAYSKMDCGIPFTGRPTAVRYDYKADVGNRIIRSTGFSSKKEIGGKDYAFIAVYLQKRTEDENGNVSAKRVGTAYRLFTEDRHEWVNGEILPVKYGDISSDPDFIPEMDLKNGDIVYYCKNSYGKIVPINEDGWADADEEPTHIVIWISSSCGEAFQGGLGNRFWVDNFRLLYE